MAARDSNNATWFLLRYAADFKARVGLKDETLSPLLDDSLHYDDMRHRLELRPEPSLEESELLPGRAVDVDGNVYRVDSETGELRVLRCDGSENLLLCDRHAFATPAGMALDRRGLLYVTDSQSQRVVVIEPDDGSVRNIFGVGNLSEPVDVTIAADGRIFVADRRAGRIVAFDSRHRFLAYLEPRNNELMPIQPRPIVVMIDADGSLLVADATYPRLLRFDRDFQPLAEVELSTYLDEMVGGSVSLDSLTSAYGKRLPRYLAGVCASDAWPPNPASREVGQRLAEVHRALRLLGLRLGRRFAEHGIFVSAVLDSGRPGTTWHRVEVDAEFAAGTQLSIETATADDPRSLLREALDHPERGSLITWQAPRQKDRPIPFTAAISDQLIQSPPGRYLRLKMTLESEGDETPRVSAIRVRYPRVSYLDSLPPVYRRDRDSARFLEQFLALVEQVFTGVEDRYDEFSRQLNLDAAPREIIDWLACLVDLSFDPSWPIEKRRALTAEAMDLYRRRGTVAALQRYVEIYTGREPLIRERFQSRPVQPAFLGSPGSVLGCSFGLTQAIAHRIPEEILFRSYAHRFTMLVYLDDQCDAELVLPVVRRIVEINKPAHTQFTLQVVLADARVGLQSTVGTDFVLGAAEMPGTLLGGCPLPGSPQILPSVLGGDSILGHRRPHYIRPIVQALS